jgi:hypothetical protein
MYPSIYPINSELSINQRIFIRIHFIGKKGSGNTLVPKNIFNFLRIIFGNNKLLRPLIENINNKKVLKKMIKENYRDGRFIKKGSTPGSILYTSQKYYCTTI